jgi:hypothetical protein
MRIAVTVGPICGALSIVLGVLDVIQGHGILVLTTGCVLTVFWLLIFPDSQRTHQRGATK